MGRGRFDGITRNLARNARSKRTELLTDDGVLTQTTPEASVRRALQRAEREAVMKEALATRPPPMPRWSTSATSRVRDRS